MCDLLQGQSSSCKINILLKHSVRVEWDSSIILWAWGSGILYGLVLRQSSSVTFLGMFDIWYGVWITNRITHGVGSPETSTEII